MRKTATLFLALLAGAVPLTAKEATMLTVSSPAFAAGQPIPEKYTCQGDETSPPLAWNGAPDGTKSFAVIVDDPDAPDPAAPQRTFVHWVLYNVPPTTTRLVEGASGNGLPAGATQGRNDFGKTRFGGPCPPTGRHRYFFKVYALDTTLAPRQTLDKAGLLDAMKGHELAHAELIGTYQKGD